MLELEPSPPPRPPCEVRRTSGSRLFCLSYSTLVTTSTVTGLPPEVPVRGCVVGLSAGGLLSRVSNRLVSACCLTSFLRSPTCLLSFVVAAPSSELILLAWVATFLIASELAEICLPTRARPASNCAWVAYLLVLTGRGRKSPVPRPVRPGVIRAGRPPRRAASSTASSSASSSSNRSSSSNAYL